MTGRRLRVAGLGFHHGHIEEQLRIALARDDTELVGVHHPERGRLDEVADRMGIEPALRHEVSEQLWAAEPDIVILCSATADHAGWVEQAADHGAHVLVEKPFASSAAEARRMITAQRSADRWMVVNWPLAYYPVHRTARRLIADGAIGAVRELHYYDGNRGPFARLDPRGSDPSDAWWFDPAAGGGALQDYLGYGVTLATWFLDGELPERVTAARHIPLDASVDTHAVVTAEYAWGLATFQARWGTLTDPWVEQSLPRTGFVIVGAAGALASHDYAPTVRLYDRAHPDGVHVPVDGGTPTAFAELVTAIREGTEPVGPAAPSLSLGGQLIVDAAVASAERGSAVELDVA